MENERTLHLNEKTEGMTRFICITSAVLACLLTTIVHDPVAASAFPIPADAVPDSGVKKINNLSPMNKQVKAGGNPNRITARKHNPLRCLSLKEIDA